MPSPRTGWGRRCPWLGALRLSSPASQYKQHFFQLSKILDKLEQELPSITYSTESSKLGRENIIAMTSSNRLFSTIWRFCCATGCSKSSHPATVHDYRGVPTARGKGRWTPPILCLPSWPLFAFLPVNGQCQNLRRKVTSYQILESARLCTWSISLGERRNWEEKLPKPAQVVALHFARAANVTREGNTLATHSLACGEWESAFPGNFRIQDLTKGSEIKR